MDYDNYTILATCWCYGDDMHPKWYKVIKRMAFTNDTHTHTIMLSLSENFVSWNPV